MNHRNTPPALPPTPSPWRPVAKNAWLLMTLVGVLALLPGFGFLMWIVGPPVLFVVLIQGIIVMSKGGSGEGAAILLIALAMPLWLFAAPVVVGALTLDPSDYLYEDEPTTKLTTKMNQYDVQN